jgi:hypothetical protein
MCVLVANRPKAANCAASILSLMMMKDTMRILFAALVAFATVAHPVQADTSAAAVPSDDALVELVLGKHVRPENGSKGQVASFYAGGVFKQRTPGGDVRELSWRVEGSQICLANGDQGECFQVISTGDDHITLKALAGKRKENTQKMLFVNEQGIPQG